MLLYHNPISANSRRVWIALLEKEIPFEEIVVKLDGAQLTPEFLKISPFRIQQPSGNVEGKATDLEIAAKEISYQKDAINRILAANTGRPQELIENDTLIDFFLSATEAKAYGLIDEIVTKPPASA